MSQAGINLLESILYGVTVELMLALVQDADFDLFVCTTAASAFCKHCTLLYSLSLSGALLLFSESQTLCQRRRMLLCVPGLLAPFTLLKLAFPGHRLLFCFPGLCVQ